MLHNMLRNQKNSHYCVNTNCLGDCILVQLGDSAGNQVRLQFNKEDAEDMIKLLQISIEKLGKKED